MALRTIVIDSKLKPVNLTVNSIQSEKSVEEHWFNLAKEYFTDLEFNPNKINKSLYTTANGPYTDKSSNAVLDAFLWAHYRHHDIILSPDDMWLLVSLYFSVHVYNNPEQLRSIFVEQDAKIVIKISESDDEKNWDEVLRKTTIKTMKSTKTDVSQLLSPHFSTTEKVESALSTACIMRVFKPDFDYRNVAYASGIRQVHFMGTLDDWKSLRHKTHKLKVFTRDRFQKYIDGLLPVFDQLIETYKGSVSRRFWSRVCNVRQRRGSEITDGQEGEILTGWITLLFYRPNMSNRNLSEFRLPCIHAPIELLESSTGKKTLCRIIGGFHGIYSADNRYKPVMSVSVIEETTLPMSVEGCHADDDEDQVTHL